MSCFEYALNGSSRDTNLFPTYLSRITNISNNQTNLKNKPRRMSQISVQHQNETTIIMMFPKCLSSIKHKRYTESTTQ